MFKRIRRKITVAPVGATKTEQKWRDRQDVNSIVARCLRGDTSGLVQCGMNYADLTVMPSSLQELLNQRISAEASFDSLPEEAKAHYVTPSNFVNAIGNDSERANLERFGLLKPLEKETPIKVEVTNPTNPVTPEGAV